MTSAGHENVLFFLTVAVVALGIVSTVLGVLAWTVLKENRAPKVVPKKNPGTDLFLLKDSERILGHETPTDVMSKQKIRRSPILAAEGRRDYFLP